MSDTKKGILIGVVMGTAVGILAWSYTADYRQAQIKADANRYLAALEKQCQSSEDFAGRILMDYRSAQPYCLRVMKDNDRIRFVVPLKVARLM